MKLKRLKMSNIRSYKNAEIVFPDGATLLSGNVGSGKTSILMAIDFALFGLRKIGGLSGTGLLRAGQDFGSVQLEFSLNGKSILIKRDLKREKTRLGFFSFSNEECTIIIDGIKEEVKSSILRKKVIELLNYPKALMREDKSLIYRYTVYTPQEEMKRIIEEKEETRMDILRRVFNIEKYKRIKDNLMVVIGRLRERKAVLQGQIADIKEIEEEISEKERQILGLNEELGVVCREISDVCKEIEEKQDLIKKYESDIETMKRLKEEIRFISYKLGAKRSESKRLQEQASLLSNEIALLKSQNLNAAEPHEGLLDSKLTEYNEVSNKIKMLEQGIQDLNTKIVIVTKNINDLRNLSICPTCFQSVPDVHKDSITTSLNEEIKKHEKTLNEFTSELQTLTEKLDYLSREIEGLKKAKYEFEVVKIKLAQLDEKVAASENLLQQVFSLAVEINGLENEEAALAKSLEDYGEVEEKYVLLKKALESLNEKLKAYEITKGQLTTKIKMIGMQIEGLKEELLKKNIAKSQYEYISSLHSFLIGDFASAILQIEKNVMLKIHGDFNALFADWFQMIIGAEGVSAKINLNFSPIVEQNGYLIDYEYLSGGERTAVALAYRLALNQVINKLFGVINTKDILILDEPTDGFSSEQLERMKYVFNELSVGQLIIVSHEQRMEAFVDNVIKVIKENGVSRVV